MQTCSNICKSHNMVHIWLTLWIDKPTQSRFLCPFWKNIFIFRLESIWDIWKHFTQTQRKTSENYNCQWISPLDHQNKTVHWSNSFKINKTSIHRFWLRFSPTQNNTLQILVIHEIAKQKLSELWNKRKRLNN